MALKLCLTPRKTARDRDDRQRRLEREREEEAADAPPRRLTLIVLSQSSTSRSTTLVVGRLMPAHCTLTSTRPNRSLVSLTYFSAVASSATSPATVRMRAASASLSLSEATADERASSLRSTRVTPAAPASRNACAVQRQLGRSRACLQSTGVRTLTVESPMPLAPPCGCGGQHHLAVTVSKEGERRRTVTMAALPSRECAAAGIADVEREREESKGEERRPIASTSRPAARRRAGGNGAQRSERNEMRRVARSERCVQRTSSRDVRGDEGTPTEGGKEDKGGGRRQSGRTEADKDEEKGSSAVQTGALS